MLLLLLFCFCMLWIFGKLILLAFRATWGLTKIFFTIILLPLFLVGLVLKGLLLIAFPILIIVGISSFFIPRA